MFHHQPEHISGSSAKGQTRGHLSPALRNGIRNDAINPDRREQDCHSAKNKHQRHPQLLTTNGVRHEIRHTFEVDSNLRIQLAYLFANR
jgi:hypothetical protein